MVISDDIILDNNNPLSRPIRSCCKTNPHCTAPRPHLVDIVVMVMVMVMVMLPDHTWWTLW